MEFKIAQGWPNPRHGDPDEKERAKSEAVRDFLANHTLIVGQSRSGKSTAARRIIEEVVLGTQARVVVLDPNADFVELDKVDSSAGGDDTFKGLWTEAMKSSCIISPRRGAEQGISWGVLSSEEQAVLLGLSPETTPLEYRAFRRHLSYEESHSTRSATLEGFRKSKFFEFSTGEDVDRYRTWLEYREGHAKWVAADLNAVADEKTRVVVVDLSVKQESVRYMSAARVLEVLWDDGERRREELLTGDEKPWNGTIVVIDEAHLFAPPNPADPQRRFLAERIERFCDQGKKLNLFVILITQQPGKLNPRILAECNNRIVMRMNEQLSLRALEEAFGGDRGRYDGALTFKPSQGWALIEGALLSDTSPPEPGPRGVKFERGRTKEGGGSPSTAWVKPAAKK